MPLLTIEQFAERAGAKADEIAEACRLGSLPHFRMGPRMVRLDADLAADYPACLGVPGSEVLADELIDLLDLNVDDAALLRGALAGPRPVAQEVVRRALRTGLLLHRRNVSPAARAAVVARDGRCCQYCGRTIGPRTRLTIDHVLSILRGGTNDVENLVVACWPCNGSKGTEPAWRGECGHLRFGPMGQCRWESCGTRSGTRTTRKCR